MLGWAEGKCAARVFEPLAEVAVTVGAAGLLTVTDGAGREYLRRELVDPVPTSADGGFLAQAVGGGPVITFVAAGAPGVHRARLTALRGAEPDPGSFPNGSAEALAVDFAPARSVAPARGIAPAPECVLAELSFRLQPHTHVDHGEGEFGALLEKLRYTMLKASDTGIQTAFHKGRIYRFFVCWLRDHVHTMKGMRYFEPDLKTAIEFYGNTQRADGMVWDNVGDRQGGRPTHWDHRFDYDGFIQPEGELELKRIPVENDVEYLFVEGLYNTWKATGDDGWMATLVDKAVSALCYSRTSPYRWSERFGLLKRGFTIDTWDFQADEDSALVGGDIMVVKLGTTRFGIMHGDNTGYVAACRQLAEMLDACGRTQEAADHRQLADEIWRRLVDVAWNGRFFTHHVPEDPALTRDLGVDQSTQLSLSNAYALNRGLPQAMARPIVAEYKAIAANLPPGSPGEWYTIYPPFGKGFGAPAPPWEYMNAGVTSIVAGELASGAFGCGEEAYGVDVLRRLSRLADATGGYVHCCYRGAAESSSRSFVPLDLEPVANAAAGIPDWDGNAPPEYHELPQGPITLEGISFLLPDRKRRGGKGCLLLGQSSPGSSESVAHASVPVGGVGGGAEALARSLYLVHTGGHGLVGTLRWEYADGTHATQPIIEGDAFHHWWAPEEKEQGSSTQSLVLAWHGSNHMVRRVSVSLKGFANPHPKRGIRAITFSTQDGSGQPWAVFGATLSDADVLLRPRVVSYGIPDNWGAAAVTYALLQGLVGVADGPGSVCLSVPTVSPRWAAAGAEHASSTEAKGHPGSAWRGPGHKACVTLPAGGGYVAYEYSRPSADEVVVLLTGSGERGTLRVMLPWAGVSEVLVDGEPAGFATEQVGDTAYVVLSVRLDRASRVVVRR